MSAQYTLKASLFFLSSLIMGAAESTVRPQQPDFDAMDLYEVLDIHEEATNDEIKRAYYKCAVKHHPDKNPDDVDGATRRFTRIQEAYETLTDTNKRLRYNYLRSVASPPENSSGTVPTSYSTSDEPPGAWTSGPSAPQQGWYEYFFGPSESSPPPPPPKMPGPKPSPLVYSSYVATRSNDTQRMPGVSPRDLVEFINSISIMVALDTPGAVDRYFTIIGDLFRCLAYDEKEWGNRRCFPDFGDQGSVWCRSDLTRSGHDCTGVYEVKQFYDNWSGFKTSKTFEWVRPYRYSGYGAQADERLARNANKPYQEETRQAYNKIIQIFVQDLRLSDPRHKYHSIVERNHPQRSTSGGSNNKKKFKKKRW